MLAMAKTNPSVIDLEDVDKEARAITAAGLSYKAVEIKREEIDLIHSTTFNARFEDRVNDDTVLKYALLMERGTTFPRITVFFDHQLKKYIVISGVHRVTAHQMADLHSPIAAFEVLVNPPGDPSTMERISDLGFVLNNTGPFGLSHAEALQAAIRAIERGHTTPAVALQYGLKEEEVSLAYENYKLDRELIQNGLDPRKFVRKGDKIAVLSLPSTGLMLECQRLLTRFVNPKTGAPVLSGDQFVKLVQTLRTEKNETTRQEIIAATQKDLQSGKRMTFRKGAGKSALQAYPSFRRAAGLIRNASPSEMAAARCTSADAARTFLDEVNELRSVLDTIEQAVRTRWPS